MRVARPERVSSALLGGHVVLTLFASLAFATILAGAPPAWLQQEPNLSVYRWSWKLSGPLVVLLGAAATWTHANARFGWRRSTLTFLAASAVALGAETLGTTTGFPFGAYEYTTLLGYRIFGRVPYPIPISWYFMLYASLAICGRLMVADDSNRGRWKWAAVAGVILTLWDVSMDPAMVVTAHWVWHVPGFFYGMPLSNWLGWLLTGTIVARVMLAFVAPSEWQRLVSPSRFPLVLYAINGVMPIAICFSRGLTGAGWLGMLAMALPLTAAMKDFGFRISERGSGARNRNSKMVAP
jgi:putative membrane protein